MRNGGTGGIVAALRILIGCPQGDGLPNARWVAGQREHFRIIKFRWFFGAVGGVVRLLGTPLRENCRAPLAGMADWKSEGKAEALGISAARVRFRGARGAAAGVE